jgi:hypothetical protein
MKDQMFRIAAVVFALVITAGITSCEILSGTKKETPVKKTIVAKKAPVKKKASAKKKIVKKKLSASDKALQALKKEWNGRMKCETIDGKLCAVVDNKTYITSKKFTPVKAGKKYVLSGTFKSLGKAPSKVYYGFICYDKKKRQISSSQSNIIFGTATTLVKACKKGDKVLVFKANKKWKKGNYAIAFNAKDDFSDLPNRAIVYKITKVIPKGANMEVQLPAPLKKAYPAGTKVRKHTSAYGYYLYSTICSKKMPNSWKSYSASVTLAKPGQMGWKFFRPGTAFVKVVILPNYGKKKDEKLAFKDLSLKVSK